MPDRLEMAKKERYPDCCVPTRVLDDVIDVSMGAEACAAVKSNGDVWCWGNNNYGQFEVVTDDDYIKTPQKSSMTDAKKVFMVDSIHNSVCIIKNDDTMWLSGPNRHGRYLHIMEDDAEEPIQILDNIRDVFDLSMNMCALKNDNTLLCWDQWGFDTVNDVLKFDFDGYRFVALKNDGSVWVGGTDSEYYALGLGEFNPNLLGCEPTMILDGVITQAEMPISVSLNDEMLDFDVPPVMEDNRTLVPVRAIFEAMGMSVEWDAATSTVTAIGNGNSISMRINDVNATVNGEVKTLDVPAKVIEGRTLVPVRFIAESLGAEVQWDAEKRIVYISYDPDRKMYIKVKDEKNGAFATSGIWILAKPWQYTSVEIVDAYGNPITDKSQYTITVSDPLITIDENLTLSVKAEGGSCNIKLYDHHGQQKDVRVVSIVDKTNAAKFMWDNQNAHEALTDNFYSFELWDDYQEEDGWMWAGAALSNFWSNPIDYWGEVNYKRLMTAVLTDALINDAAVAAMNKQLEISYINSKVQEHDVWIDVLEKGAEWQSKEVQGVIEDIRQARDSLLKHLEMPQLSAEQIDDIVKKTHQDYLDKISFQNVKEYAMYSELLEQQGGRKSRSDKVTSALERIGVAADILNVTVDGLSEYHALCALADVRDKYVGGLEYLADNAVVPEVKEAAEEVAKMMNQGFADGLTQIVKEAGWSFVQTELGQKVASKVLAKGAAYILPKLGVSAAKTVEIVGKIGSTAKDLANGWIWVEIANWATEAAVGAETGSNACFDLRALMHIQGELKIILNSMSSEMRLGRNDYIEEYLMVASLMKPVAIYASHLNRVICNAQDNSAVKKFMRYMQKDEVYQDNYDRLYEAEITKIGNAVFVY